MYEFLHLVVIPLIIGMVEIIKKAGLPVQFSPIVAVAIGLFFGIFYLDTLKEGIIVGLMVGLSASGLYSGGKNLRNGHDYDKQSNKM
ncbi:hypothetical protein [Niallia endozanthoxylica]|uniref:Holin n=1 Tax=Niallia endozanthoxylica TaxID=2036016 RepID=A0A5J5HV88_9BACI|nr:hypothetical protein [Niallia endozanthoxylica]KAA9026081.1 hypothetical protein F4V44_09385 [Niallia endozanthoxylica]